MHLKTQKFYDTLQGKISIKCGKIVCYQSSIFNLIFSFQVTHSGYNTMGLYKQYFKISQYARNQIFKIDAKNANGDDIPLQMLISQQFNHSK